MLAAEPRLLQPASIRVSQLPTELTDGEWSAVATAVSHANQRVRLAARRALRRVLDPLRREGEALGLEIKSIRTVQRAVLEGMLAHRVACGAWEGPTWVAVASHAGSFRPNVLAVAYQLGGLSGEQMLTAGVHPTHLARRLFGQPMLDGEVMRVRHHLKAVGYGWAALDDNTLTSTLAILFIQVGQAKLEALSVEVIEAAHRAAPASSDRRSSLYRLAHALHGMGLLPRGITRRVYSSVADESIDPEWAAWCARWQATTTLAPKTAENVHYGVLRAARWLACEHPNVHRPEDWTREVALAYVAAVNRGVVGDHGTSGACLGEHRGAPLSPRSKDRLLGTVRIFLRDCQEWGWCPRHFDPSRALATPRSVKALIAPNPRVLADDVWAKLLWAGLQLQETDLPSSDGGAAVIGRMRPTYPIELVKAITIAWLFAGLAQ